MVAVKLQWVKRAKLTFEQHPNNLKHSYWHFVRQKFTSLIFFSPIFRRKAPILKYILALVTQFSNRFNLKYFCHYSRKEFRYNGTTTANKEFNSENKGTFQLNGAQSEYGETAWYVARGKFSSTHINNSIQETNIYNFQKVKIEIWSKLNNDRFVIYRNVGYESENRGIPNLILRASFGRVKR